MQQKGTLIFRSIVQLIGSVAFLLLILGALFFEENYFKLYVVIIVWSGLALVLIPYAKMIKIDKSWVHIFPSNKKVAMSNRAMIHFNIKIIGRKAQVKFLNQTILLKNLGDISILTESIADLLDLEFAENYTFFDNTEVIVYQSKQFQNPHLPLIVSIKDNQKILQIIAKIDTSNQLVIDKLTNEIQYKYDSHKSFIKRIHKSIKIDKITKIALIINQIGITKHTSFSIRLIEKSINVLGEEYESRYQDLFVSTEAFSELETRRTVEYLYQKFQSLDCFKNIEIIKSE